MNKLKVSELVFALSGELINGNLDFLIDNVSIDSRNVNASSLFIAIVGEVHDAHDFISSAYDNGCRTFVVSKRDCFFRDDMNLILVDDTKKAYGNIAKYYRDKFSIDIIGITGSTGKTTVKDMVYGVLSTKYKTLKNLQNLNNEIGVPKTLLRLDDTYSKAIIEMGMQKKGEIKYLRDIVRPKIGIITKIGTAHIEFFDNQDGIFNAKMEIADGFNEDNILIVNGDDSYLKRLKEKNHLYKLYTYGFDSDNDLYCKSFSISDVARFTCVYKGNSYDFMIPSPAKHNVLNAMAAIMVGFLLDIPYELIKNGLSCYEASNNRMDIFKIHDMLIINDSYNANYDSMVAMLLVLANYTTRKVAILGDMLELGDKSTALHQDVAKSFLDNKIDVLVTVGEESKVIDDYVISHGFDKNMVFHFSNVSDLLDKIDGIVEDTDAILIKGSNGIGLSKVAEYFKEKVSDE